MLETWGRLNDFQAGCHILFLIGISKVNYNLKLRNQGHCGILSFRQYVRSGKRKLWQTADPDPFTSCALDLFYNSNQVPLAVIVCLFHQWNLQKSQPACLPHHDLARIKEIKAAEIFCSLGERHSENKGIKEKSLEMAFKNSDFHASCRMRVFWQLDHYCVSPTMKTIFPRPHPPKNLL